jgi:hypothetical protein
MRILSLIFAWWLALQLTDGQNRPRFAKIERTSAVHVTARTGGALDAVQIASGNVAGDFFGEADTRSGTWGTADAVSVPIVFDGVPAGQHVQILKIEGDVVAWPKIPLGTVALSGAMAGVLAGFQDGDQAAVTCDLCAADTFVYVQASVSSSGVTRPFTYAGLNRTLSENTVTLVVASWLNTFGVPIHAEVTYTIWFRSVRF